ncbi:HlyD family secretion protein [Flavobacterium agricola]|uniref:HlyD family secretion protein n=1 Tax=Flavobacterium agricola TaxID=2870839 RepID=A0ABY6M192_9FLAO|nr:HlyD family secretion protein [Flavobacterium agricola]UYW02329.1 HlyD family secretion protein [Flavobacterium agricola]
MNHKRKKNTYNIIVGALVLGGLVWVGSKFFFLGNVEYTDNAQVKQLIVPANARVSGYIKEIKFDEYEPVKKGDTLLIIEDTEFRYRLAQAEADYQSALAGKDIVASSVKTIANNTAVTDAGLAELKALLDNAETDYKRYKKLLEQQSVTQQEYDGKHTQYVALKAKYETLARQKQTTILATNEQNLRLMQNDAVIELAKAAVELAKLNLSYTVIVAPTDGHTGRKNLQVGQLLQPGQPVVDIIDNNDIWIIANYKETQTHQIKENQEVELAVDALPGVTLKGIVKSVANATGASFSVLPQDNSAGNFVKIEQRIPVKIEFADSNDAELLQKLRAGMNVECKVLL